MEKPLKVVELTTPEKSKEELYLDALKAKKDVLSSHYAMNQMRKNIDRRIEEIPDDNFKNDPEVQQYEILKKEYDRCRELFLASLNNLGEDDRQSISELTNLTKVETVLSSLKKPAQTEATSLPEDLSDETLIHPDELNNRSKEIERILAGKYNTLHQDVSVIDRRPLKEEIRALEAEKGRLETKPLEKEEPEINSDGPAPKEFIQRMRDSYDKTKEAIMGANRISGDSETVESRMSPLGLREEAKELKSQQIERPDLGMTLEEINQKIVFAKRQILGLKGESVEYWESKKAEFINQEIRHAIDRGIPLSLAYWEAKRQEFKHGQKIEHGSKQILSKQERKFDQIKQELEQVIERLDGELSGKNKTEPPTDKQKDRFRTVEKDEHIEPIEESKKPIKIDTELKQDLGVEEKVKIPQFVTEPEIKHEQKPVILEKVELTKAVVERVVSLDQKDAIDHFIEQGEGPAEVILDLAHKESVDKEAVDKVVDEALDGVEVSLDHEKVIPQEKTFFKKIRDSLKNKVVIYVGVGLMALMAWNSETREHFLKTPTSVVKILDKVPDIQIATDFPRMVASEATRYEVKPYLVARYIGSNDYFNLEAIKLADTVGLEGVANGMYERALADYVSNFSETRQDNRFTTLDKHTARGYIDTFTQIYTGHEQSESGVKTYQKLRDFLQTNFGASKAYELALKVSSEKKISPELLASAREDLLKQEKVLKSAIGKSQIYFNQEDGIFNVTHDGNLIDTYASRAGFMNIPKGGSLKSLGYERTPDGKFTISSIEYGYSTLRWRDSFLPYGAEIRPGKSGEIEYQYRGKWYSATGSEATYFDQGQKVQPNKSAKDLKYLSSRSKGGSPLTKSDFYSTDGLVTHWDKNPFGPISYRLAGRGELIHSNPTDSDNILHPSHGCIRLDKEDIKTLESYIGTGVSKITISSKTGETWGPKS